MSRYYFFIGTTAELIKLFPVIEEFKRRKVAVKIIVTGQNDLHGNELVQYLGIKEFDVVLHRGAINQSAAQLFFWFVRTFFKSWALLKREFSSDDGEKTFLIVHGDTVSTVMGAMLGRLFHVAVVHLEAGLRSFNYLHPFPEEIDRVITSHLARYHFCPNQWAVDNLAKRVGEKVNTQQNTLLDSLHIASRFSIGPELQRRLQGKPFFIFVIHRQENIYNKKLFTALLTSVLERTKSLRCVFILHEPTKASLEKFGLMGILEQNPSVVLSPRLPFFQFIPLLTRCEFIITDGGSNQEECSYIGKPCCILRKCTERTEGLNKNVVVSKNDLATINHFIDSYRQYQYPTIDAAARPSEIITEELMSFGRQ